MTLTFIRHYFQQRPIILCRILVPGIQLVARSTQETVPPLDCDPLPKPSSVLHNADVGGSECREVDRAMLDEEGRIARVKQADDVSSDDWGQTN